jgi:hypothetical protein
MFLVRVRLYLGSQSLQCGGHDIHTAFSEVNVKYNRFSRFASNTSQLSEQNVAAH